MKNKFWLPAIIVPFALAACGEKTTSEKVEAAENDVIEVFEEAVEAAEETAEEAVDAVEHAIDEVEEAAEEAAEEANNEENGEYTIR